MGGGVRQGAHRFRPRTVGLVDMYGKIDDEGFEFHRSLVRRDLDVVPGATHAARWAHEAQPISNQPMGVGLPHHAGRYLPEGSPLSPPGRYI